MKRASHIPAPRAAACDDLHLRASAQHWHVSTFCVTGNSPEFPVITSENTLREFPLVIATVAKVSRKRGLWLVVRVNKKTAHVLLPCRQSEFCVLSVIYYVTVQYPHTYRNLPRSFPSDAWQVTSKNPFQIGFADGIFAFRPMFYYGQRSKCADLLNSYFITF